MKSDKHETWQESRFQYCCESCPGAVEGTITNPNTDKKKENGEGSARTKGSFSLLSPHKEIKEILITLFDDFDKF